MENSVLKFRTSKMREDGFVMDAAPAEFRTMENMEKMGISFNADSDPVAYICDGLSTVTDPSVSVPYQFLQFWMRDPIKVVTQATVADDFLGRANYGEWWHEAIVLRIRELTGHTAPYGDWANAPRVGRNYNQEERTIVRFSAGLVTGALEAARTAAMGGGFSQYQDERDAIAQAFRLDTNAVAFFGYRLGLAKNYGILNDPNLAAYKAVPKNADNKTEWVDKTYYDIVRDLNTMVAELQVQCGGQFIPSKDAFKIGLALGCEQYLNTPNEHGHTVKQFIEATWKKAEIVAIPEFDGAIGGENAIYLKLEKLGTSPCAEQIVPAAMRLVGSAQRETGVSELYSNATAGCFVEQPLGIVRYFGI